MKITTRARMLVAMAMMFGSPLGGAEPSVAGPPIIELEMETGVERGLPIAWYDREVILLRGDGSIRQFERQIIRRHQILDQPFQAENAIRLRGKLQQEFGRRFAVDGGGDFAIVASPTTIRGWVDRFSQLQRSFEHYFRTRGLPLRPAEFPLVGIVFPTQAEFLEHARQVGANLGKGTVGFYSPVTNRLYLYEQSGTDDGMQEAMATVWHEAAHQLAFNRGIHQRLSQPPLWLTEGLASIFEAPGLMAPRSTMDPKDLINRSRWETWNRLAEDPDQMASLLDGMILEDHLFRSHPDVAYTIAWGVSLYLAERDTRHYVPYLAQLARLEVGVKYGAKQRLQDFQQAFPSNSLLLIKAADRFLKGL